MMAPIVEAIAATMTCDKCPFQCGRPYIASTATCVNKWHDILSNIALDSMVNVVDYILDKARGKNNG